MSNSQKVRLSLALDRAHLQKSMGLLSPWVVSEIRRRKLVTEGGDTVSFCGFVASGDEVFAFLPRGTPLPDGELGVVKLATLLARCIDLYVRQGTATKIAGDSRNEGVEGKDQLAIIRELLDDYRLNGLYVTTSRRRTINAGKTDWKRTISRVMPFPDKCAIPVYPVLLGTSSMHNVNSIVAKIHASVIARLDRMFGWWVTGQANGRVAPDISESDGLLGRREYCLSILRRELSSVYADRNLRLLANLIWYLQDGTTEGTSPVVIGLRDFHWAWERMLGEIVGFRSDLGSELPLPVYYYVDGNRVVAANKAMRTDIIVERRSNKTAVVVDAKYYAALSADNAPGWPDLVKQFFYAKALRAIKPGWKIGNVFVFPGVEGKLLRAAVESMDGKFVHAQEFPWIRCMYANPAMVMHHYAGRTKWGELTSNLICDSP